MLNDIILEHLIAEDFDKFDFDDKPMRQFCECERSRHISMACRLVQQRFAYDTVYEWTDVKDFIHGLNHIFFNGVTAGQVFEWQRSK